MAKKVDVWRVKPQYDGHVTVGNECEPVVLSNSLSAEQLAALAELPNVAEFMIKTTQNAVSDEG